ncbi:MAG: T9SS type A sorting domain-containing protein [Bacteroidota bacterium]
MERRLVTLPLILIFLFALPIGLQADLSVAFEKDTVYACKDMSIVLEPQVSGGNQPYEFSWSNGESSQSIEVNHADEGFYTYWIETVDASGDRFRDTVVVSVLAECVWPGDANGDRSSNHFDLLAMGVGFGHTGPERPDAHTNWIGQTAHQWTGHDHAGVNFVHADANGDGLVDISDMQVIGENYTPALPGTGGSIGSAEDPSLFLDWDNYTVSGDTLRVPVSLGTIDIPADSTYGLALTLDYDPTEIPAGAISTNTESSWLGTEGQDMIRMEYSFPNLGVLDVAITRKDQIEGIGSGEILEIVVIIEDLILIVDEEDPFPINIDIQNPRLVSSSGRIMPLFTKPQAIVLSSDNELEPTAKLDLFPNPAQLRMTIEWQDIVLEELYILDKTGKRYEIPTNFRNNTAVLDVTSLSTGLYTLIIREKNKAYIRRFLKN